MSRDSPWWTRIQIRCTACKPNLRATLAPLEAGWVSSEYKYTLIFTPHPQSPQGDAWPHSSSPTPSRDQASDSRQVWNVDSEPPATSARRPRLQSPGRTSDIPVGCYRNSRVSSGRLGRPEGGRTRHLPPPLWCCEWGFSFRMCTLVGAGEMGIGVGIATLNRAQKRQGWVAV